MSDAEVQARGEEYARTLRNFSPRELDEAYQEVLRGWDKPTWPPPGVFASAAMAFRKEWFGSTAPKPDQTAREAAAAQYLQDGTTWPPGFNMPYKALIAARVAGLESAGLPKGTREELPPSWAAARAKEVLAAQASGKVS